MVLSSVKIFSDILQTDVTHMSRIHFLHQKPNAKLSIISLTVIIIQNGNRPEKGGTMVQ